MDYLPKAIYNSRFTGNIRGGRKFVNVRKIETHGEQHAVSIVQTKIDGQLQFLND